MDIKKKEEEDEQQGLTVRKRIIPRVSSEAEMSDADWNRRMKRLMQKAEIDAFVEKKKPAALTITTPKSDIDDFKAQVVKLQEKKKAIEDAAALW